MRSRAQADALDGQPILAAEIRGLLVIYGVSWSYGRLAKHYRISEQRVGQVVSSVVDKIKKYACVHA